MAIIKAVPTSFGVDATFHVISRVDINWLTQETKMEIVSYANKDAYENGNNYMAQSVIEFTKEDLIVDKTTAPCTQLYSYLMNNHPLFMDAISDEVKVDGAEQLHMVETPE